MFLYLELVCMLCQSIIALQVLGEDWFVSEDILLDAWLCLLMSSYHIYSSIS